MSNYKISINDLESAGGIAKLERDGFSNEQIHKAMYDKTDGASTRQRENIMRQLYQRDRSHWIKQNR